MMIWNALASWPCWCFLLALTPGKPAASELRLWLHTVVGSNPNLLAVNSVILQKLILLLLNLNFLTEKVDFCENLM